MCLKFPPFVWRPQDSPTYLPIALRVHQGGNDHEIFEDERTIGHAVTCPDDTMKLLNELFLTGK